MDGEIIRLIPENYHKCANIWDMQRHKEQAKKWYEELHAGNRIIFVYEKDGAYLGEAALVLENSDPDYTIPGKRIYLSRMIVKKECRGAGHRRFINRFSSRFREKHGV